MSKSNREKRQGNGGGCSLTKLRVFIIAVAFFVFMMCFNTFLFPTLGGGDRGSGNNGLRSHHKVNNVNSNSKVDDANKLDYTHTMMNTESDEGSLNMDKVNSERSVSSNQKKKTIRKKKIAYAITVTKDGPFVDGALVLGFAAQRVHNNTLRQLQGLDLSDYDAELVAFVAPSVVTTRAILGRFGWRIIEKTIPVAFDEIENKAYVQVMKDSGCCGADEFIKLWAFALTEYHRVVHLDMDSIIFESMDDLYSRDKDLLYTGDYSMMGGSPVAPAQGGFLVIRPSAAVFEEFRSVIRKGDYGSKGWGGSGIGNFWGGQTIQGILPYFYHVLASGRGEEVNRCVYNCMVDNPYHPYKNDNDKKICLDGQEMCEDCRLQKAELVKSAHYTICQKPWTCTKHDNPRNKVLCAALHEKWFFLREGFESSIGIDTSYRIENNVFPKYFGMCRSAGENGYLPIPI